MIAAFIKLLPAKRKTRGGLQFHPVSQPMLRCSRDFCGHCKSRFGRKASLSFVVAAPLAWMPSAQAQIVAPVAPVSSGDTAIDWRLTTLTDLDEIHRQISENTPIPFVDTPMRDWLTRGLEEAKRRAQTVTTQAGHTYTLMAYVNGFREPHINMSAITSLPPAKSPGFVVTWDAKGARVVWTAPENPNHLKVGDLITACDGQSIFALSSERVFSYTYDARLPSDHRRALTRFFLDRSVPFAPAPRECLVNGNSHIIEWRAISDGKADEQYWTAYSSAALGGSAQLGVSEIGDGILWIGAPSFGGDDAYVASLSNMFDDAQKLLRAKPSPRAVVVDIRGNGGGNSAWGGKLAKLVLGNGGKPRKQPAWAMDWRASPENLANSIATAERLSKTDGLFWMSLGWKFQVVPGLKGAIERGEPIWRQGPKKPQGSSGLTTRRPNKDGQRTPYPVFVLTNGTCMSACLTFLDEILHVPGVKLIGSNSGMDGILMEIRSVPLPSGTFTINFGMKAAVGRPRGAGEHYAPDIAYDGIWKDEAVRAWTLEIAQRAASMPDRID
jgi:hypothetical protein